jgi:hypothetical protein
VRQVFALLRTRAATAALCATEELREEVAGIAATATVLEAFFTVLLSDEASKYILDHAMQ